MPTQHVVFIGAVGRSGSTLLDRLLGECSEFFSVGELRHLWKQAFVDNASCGCGQRLLQCPFWASILRDVFGTGNAGVGDELVRLHRSVDRLRYLPYLLWPRIRPSSYERRLSRYKQILKKLYDSIAEHSGAKYIVDSSKSPVHGLILGGMTGIFCHPIHLVRDGRAVAYAWRKKKAQEDVHRRDKHMVQFGAIRSSLTWVFWNSVLIMFPRRFTAEQVFLRYEDLAASPERHVRELLRDVAGPDVRSPSISRGKLHLHRAHTVGGNPMRFETGSVTVVVDDEWRKQFAWGPRLLATLITLPLLKRFGYILS